MKQYTAFIIPKHVGDIRRFTERLVIKRLRIDTKEKLSNKENKFGMKYKYLCDVEAKTKKEAFQEVNKKSIEQGWFISE